jgi:K+-transporting ATPase KdpF subunit
MFSLGNPLSSKVQAGRILCKRALESAHCRAWNGETCNARSDDVFIHGCLFRPGVSLRQGLPEVEVTAMHIDFITAVALILSVLLLGYLALTLLFPERF